MRETIVFNGVAYHRYPDSENQANRAYFLGSIDGKAVRLHQEIYKFYRGKIPRGFHVHHKDGNTLNNSIDNLELKLKHDHHSGHCYDPEIAEKQYNGKIRFWEKQP